MAAPTATESRVENEAAEFKPYVPEQTVMKEFTWSAVALGSLLGIVFAGSSLYLVLKVGMTVSASIPVAVLAITVFRGISKSFGLRQATILENNIVQTAGSAGESIAFGVGVTMPALLILGFEMDITRVMIVSVLGGILGILAMIPLRRAFIVKLHGKPGQPGTLLYPEGTACAQVLISGEKGGAHGKTIFIGFGLAFLHKFLTEGMGLVMAAVRFPLPAVNRAAVFAGDMASELLGVGYIIGLRTSAIMMAGAVLGYLIILPLIAYVGDFVPSVVPPAKDKLISQMSPRELRDNYLLFIGAGCVATAGLISMFRTLPMIIRSVGAGLQSMRGSDNGNGDELVTRRRTENDMSMKVVLLGSLGLIVLLAVFLAADVGIVAALAGAMLVVLFGFLFVTVSSRLTGEIGSSSNPISGMTVATLTVTCLIFLALGWTGSTQRVLALSIAAVVCVAASNGGTTAQSLKTGFLVGGTPKLMQYAILIGAMTSALVIGGTLIYGFNKAGTVYSEKPENLAQIKLTPVELDEVRNQQGATDTYEGETFIVWDTRRDTFTKEPDKWRQELREAKTGTYLVDDNGNIRVVKDAAIMGKLNERDDGSPVKREFDAPKTQVMGLIIDGVLSQKLNWSLVLVGALIALMLELCGVSALAFAVGLYVPISVSTPIFIGGTVRWGVDRYMAGKREAAIAEATDAESRARAEIEAIRKSETSPGVLLAAGYIAGGSLGGMLLAFLEFSDTIPKDLRVWENRKVEVRQEGSYEVQSMAAAMRELGFTGDAPPREHKEQVEEFAKSIRGLNEELLVMWVPLPKGTVLLLPEYQTYEVPEKTTLGAIADSKILLNLRIGGTLASISAGPFQVLASMALTPEDRAQPIYSLNKKQLPAPSSSGLVENLTVEKGVTLRLPLKKTYVVKEDTYLNKVALEVLGRNDRAATLMNTNKGYLEPASGLPPGTPLKLPQKRWPSLIFFGVLVGLLAAVGAEKLLRVKDEGNGS